MDSICRRAPAAARVVGRRIGRAARLVVPPPPSVTYAVWGAYPDNPWQEILSDGVRSAGIDVEVLDHGASLDALAGRVRDGERVVLHVSWPMQLSQPGTVDEAEARVDSAIAALRTFRAAGGRLLWTVHNVRPHELAHVTAHARLERALAGLANAIHVMQPLTAAAVAPHWSLDRARELQLPHPSYLGIYPDEIGRVDARARLGVPKDARVVLAHGLMRPYKGIGTLVRAFVEAAEHDPSLWLLVAGAPGPGFDPSELDLARDHPRARIHEGFVAADEVQVWHRAADALAMPYQAGLNSGALMLAASFGLGVIAFPCDAVRIPEAAGWVEIVEPDDPAWLVTGLARLSPAAGARAADAALQLHPQRIGSRFAREVGLLARDGHRARSGGTGIEAARSDDAADAAGRVGIVVVNYGSSSMLDGCLAHLVDHHVVVVVDNHTSEDERARVLDWSASHGVRCILEDGNGGFGHAANRGAEALLEDADVDGVLFLNPDVRVSNATVGAMVAMMRSRGSRAIVAPTIVRPDGAVWFRGGVIDWERGIARHRDEHERDRRIEWLTGACLLVPRRALVDGGLPAAYFLYWEDVAFTHAWLASGGELALTDETAVHDVGGTQHTVGSAKSLGYSFYNARNRLLFAAAAGGARLVLTWSLSGRAYERELLARAAPQNPDAARAHRSAARKGILAGVLRGAASVLASPIR